MTVREHYAGFCGPTALGSAKGMSPEDMAVFLIAFGNLDANGATHLPVIDAVLGVPCLEQKDLWAGKGALRKPNVRQWLELNPTGSYVLYVPGHVLHVKDGEVVADSVASGSLRRRVTHYWGPLP